MGINLNFSVVVHHWVGMLSIQKNAPIHVLSSFPGWLHPSSLSYACPTHTMPWSPYSCRCHRWEQKNKCKCPTLSGTGTRTILSIQAGKVTLEESGCWIWRGKWLHLGYLSILLWMQNCWFVVESCWLPHCPTLKVKKNTPASRTFCVAIDVDSNVVSEIKTCCLRYNCSFACLRERRSGRRCHR